MDIAETGRADLKPVFCAAVTDLTPGLRDELVTAAAGEALLRVDDELIEMAELEGAEAPERFARHAGAVVRRVLERMRDADASAEAQALAVNEIIGALTDEDLISLPPSVLTGVRRPAEGLGTSILPASPMIALSANELLVNGHAQPAIGQQIRSELPSATDVDFLVSFVRWTGVRTLIDELAQVVERGGRVRVITTTYMSATEPKALEELAKVGAHVRVDLFRIGRTGGEILLCSTPRCARPQGVHPTSPDVRRRPGRDRRS